MLFAVDRRTALPLIKRASCIAPATSPIPALTGLLLEADAEARTLCITATDMESSIRCSLPAQVKEGGKIVVNACILEGMFALFSGEQVRFRTLNNRLLLVQCGKTQYIIATMPDKSYPQFVFSPGENRFTVQNFMPLIKKISFAADQSAKNVALHCVKVDVEEGRVILSASNGACLAQTILPLQGNTETHFLITLKSALNLSRAFSPADILSFAVSPTAVTVSSPDTVVEMRQVAAVFLDTKAVLDSLEKACGALIAGVSLYLAIDPLDSILDRLSTIRLCVAHGQLKITCTGPKGSCSTVAPLFKSQDTPPEGFYYPAKLFSTIARTVESDAVFAFDRYGILMISTSTERFLLTPCKPYARKEVKKVKPQKNTSKKAA